MKKISKLVACLGLAFTMVACSGTKVEDAALDKLEVSIKKFTEVSSFDYSLSLDEKIENMTGKVYGSFLSKDGIQLSALVDVETQGTPMEKFMEFYFKDNMMYMSMLGTKQKSEVDLTSLTGISLDPDTMVIDKENMKKYLSEATLSGDNIHLSFDPEKFEASDLEASGMTPSDISELSMDIQLENDFMKSMSIVCAVKVEEKTQKVAFTLSLDKVNTIESLDLPSDLDSYVLVDEESALGGL